MRLVDLVKIDNRFEKSVNLLLDLFVQDKIDGYIPTRSSVKILGEYIDEIRNYSGNRATVLIGPYGKGKSHLLLVLMTILAQSCQMSALDKLIQRIEDVNKAVASNVRDVIGNMGPFLPVVINASSGSLHQAFMKGITDALIRDELSDVVPDNYYAEAVKMIQVWYKQFPNTYKAFISKLGDTNVKDFTKALSRFDEGSLDVFRTLYPELTSGGSFNPIVDNEVIAVYRSVNRILREKHGYSGIFIVFDEFSKYIEGHPVERFTEDMKVLQDMCELSNASKDEQLHLTCVAHKSIKTYGTALPQVIINAFNGVEGRLKEIYFVVSSQNNYELISDAITKKEAFQEWSDNSTTYKELIDETYTLKSFRSLFTQADYYNIVGKGCFPLTPVAAMLLLNLSEKIAQNERTIFTYITSRDKAGLARYIEKCRTVNFVGVDSVYDYFVPLFKEDTALGVHHEWLKAEYALSQVGTPIEQSIIKSLAVIHMVNKPDEIATTESFLTLALGKNKKDIHDGIAHLVEKKLIEFKNRTATYEFKNNIGVDVEQEIADVIKKRFMKADICKVLPDIIYEKYVLPKKHNMTYCMTRYFNFAFMSYSQYMSMNSISYLEWGNRPDGVVVVLVPVEEIDKKAVENHAREINDPCLAICLPNHSADCSDSVRHFLAVKSLQSNSSFIEDNLVLKKELDNLVEESTKELNDWFKSTYYPVQTVYGRKGEIQVGPLGLNRLVSDMCDEAYYDTPIINHELINRHEVSAQILRARNSILSDLINARDITPYETGSSAESTIYRATMVHPKNDKGLLLAKREIDRFISTCIGEKVSFANIVDCLMAPPYGMRKGVIPFYILDRLLSLDNMPIIYYNGKEVIFEVETINNILRRPKDYYLYVEEETVQKSEYVHDLEVVFANFGEYCRDVDKRNQLAQVSCMMQSWYRSLPQTSMIFTEPDYDGQNMKQLTGFRKLFTDMYLNPRDILFERLPKIFCTSDLQEVVSRIKKAKGGIDTHIHCVKKQAVSIIRNVFQLADGSDMKCSLLNWYETLPDIAKHSVLSTRATALMDYIQKVETSDEEEIASKIVYLATGLFIEDWKAGFGDRFGEELSEIIAEILAQKEGSLHGTQRFVLVDEEGRQVEKFYEFTPDKITSTATFFKNAIDDMLEEYDESIENNEKIGILIDAIKKLMN